MMNVTGALEAGFTVQQILNYLGQTFPELGERMTEALGAGKSAEKILRYLSRFDSKKLEKLRGNRPGKKVFPQVENRNPYLASTQAIEQHNPIPESLQSLAKAGLAGAGLVGGGMLARRALTNVIPKVRGALGGLGQTPGQMAAAPVKEAMEGVAKGLPQSAIKGLKADLDSLNLGSKIEKLASYQNPDVIGALLQKQLPPEAKQELENKFGRSFSELVKDYANHYLQKAEEKPLSRESLTHQFNQNEVQREESPETKEKLVALPDGGMGKLLEERQGIGSIELPNGEIRRRKLTEVDVEPPHLEKQITDLIQSLPEDERSAVLAFASYTPEAEFEMGGKKHNGSFLGVQFHNGDFYMYPDVTKDQFDRIVQKSTKAKTSGENPWHAWTAGQGSRGAGMHELIRELEKEFGKNFIKFKAGEGYDYFKRVREIVKKIERERKSKRQS